MRLGGANNMHPLSWWWGMGHKWKRSENKEQKTHKKTTVTKVYYCDKIIPGNTRKYKKLIVEMLITFKNSQVCHI